MIAGLGRVAIPKDDHTLEGVSATLHSSRPVDGQKDGGPLTSGDRSASRLRSAGVRSGAVGKPAREHGKRALGVLFLEHDV
jgi:hypothetical protein